MWEFTELKSGEPERDPREAEFFRHNITTEAVIRESIQNSLDARKGNEIVRLRFALGNVRKNEIKDYLYGLEDHLKECGFMPQEYNGLDDIDILVIEDFGTFGLNGNTGESIRPLYGSNFYNFWFCEGKSVKSGTEGGRWGLGKTTFHLASKLKVFWGLTIRNDDNRELLMGKALLKTHRIGKKHYNYYGYFKERNNRPIEKNKEIQDFKRKFLISRQDQSGLSIVIPMPDDEITYFSIIQSVIIHYFYAIVKGMLEVEIQDKGKCISLDKNNIMDNINKVDWQNSSWKKTNVSDLLEFIKDAEENNQIKLTINPSKPEISEESFDNLGEIKSCFNDGKLLSFHIPVKIVKKGSSPDNSFFNVYLQKSPQLKRSDELYVRSGMVIPEEREKMRGRSVRGILVAHDGAISNFLGDCENPAHTEWNERTDGFKDKYFDAIKTLRFIRNGMANIVSLLDQPPQEIQKDFLKDIFSIPITNPVTTDLPESEPPSGTEPPKIPIIKKLQTLKVTKLKGGFGVALNDDQIQLPIKARLRIAYDIRRGNPFKNYSPFDFDLNDLFIESNGCLINITNGNEMQIEVTGQDFGIEIRGFDINRDLVTDIYGGN